MREVRRSERFDAHKAKRFVNRVNKSARRGSVELEAVLITAVMFPLATALYYLAARAFSVMYLTIAGILEWPYL